MSGKINCEINWLDRMSKESKSDVRYHLSKLNAALTCVDTLSTKYGTMLKLHPKQVLMAFTHLPMVVEVYGERGQKKQRGLKRKGMFVDLGIGTRGEYRLELKAIDSRSLCITQDAEAWMNMEPL